MAAIPEPNISIQNLIDKHHQSQQEPPRPHLGASQLGHPCDRWLWLSFRWAVIEDFNGRILRLFRRGREEEANIIKDLEAIGVVFSNHQEYVDFGSHVGGSTDGMIEGGVPEAPKKRHVAEFKTHAKKSFDDLVKNGVQKSKPVHWCQMQLYMSGTGVDRALYFAVCKDDDRIYTERVHLDRAAAKQLIERGHRIALAERIPDPISTDPSWYQCKWCPAYDFCHKTHLTQEINCRTCAHATPEKDSTWSCARWESDGIPYEFQLEGCASHVLHPDLVPWTMKDSGSPHEAVYDIDGIDVRNGEGDEHVYTSLELIAGKGLVDRVRETFPGATVKEVRKVEDIPY